MTMPDGNTAALRIYEREQADNERRHEIHGSRVVESIVYDLFSGRKVARRTLKDFMEEVFTWDDHEALLVAGPDDLLAVQSSQKNRLETYIREWCEGGGSDEVAEREQDAEEDRDLRD